MLDVTARQCIAVMYKKALCSMLIITLGQSKLIWRVMQMIVGVLIHLIWSILIGMSNRDHRHLAKAIRAQLWSIAVSKGQFVKLRSDGPFEWFQNINSSVIGIILLAHIIYLQNNRNLKVKSMSEIKYEYHETSEDQCSII